MVSSNRVSITWPSEMTTASLLTDIEAEFGFSALVLWDRDAPSLDPVLHYELGSNDAAERSYVFVSDVEYSYCRYWGRWTGEEWIFRASEEPLDVFLLRAGDDGP